MLLPELEHSSSTTHGDNVESYIQLVFPRLCEETGLQVYSSGNNSACKIYIVQVRMADGDYSLLLWVAAWQATLLPLSPASSSV